MPRTLISLFAGAGGMTLGLERAGFSSVGAVERDDQAGAAFRANFGTRMLAPGLLALGSKDGDIRKVDFGSWRRALKDAGKAQVDLIAGGSPCQAFSRVGRGRLNDLRKTGFLNDPRNELWLEFFRAIETLRPRAFLFENVPGILHHGGSNVAELICRRGQALGYTVRCAILNAGAFGVPQVRERLFIVGVLDSLGVVPRLPAGNRAVALQRGHYGAHPPEEGLFEDTSFFLDPLLPVRPTARAVTAQEALADLPPFLAHRGDDYRARLPCDRVPYRAGAPSKYARLMRNWPDFEATRLVDDHICKANPRDYDTFAAMKEGDKYPDALVIAARRYERALARWNRTREGRKPRRKEFVPPYRDDVFPEKWRKLISDAPSWTVTAHLAKDCYSHIHYDSAQARTITVREAARLQSFPDGFVFSGNIGHRLVQIGNAVPPLLALGVGTSLRRLLDAAATRTQEEARLQRRRVGT